MLCCCSEEPVGTKQDVLIATHDKWPPAEKPPYEELQVEEPPVPQVEEQPQVHEKTPEPEPVAVVNPVLSVFRTEGAALGVRVDKTDPNNLVLIKVHDGILKAAAEASGKELKAGFRIVKLNGTSAAAEDMVTIMKEQKNLEIEFDAFEEKKIRVEKANKKLGVAFKADTDGTWLTVIQIGNEGAIPEWNAAAAREQKLMVSDKIVAVDGQEANAEEMMKLIQEKASVELTVYSWKSLQA